MTAYVDLPLWYWREQYWCHLLADSLEELHAFAARVGKHPRAFQDLRLPHYDLTVVQRRTAIELGAVVVTSRRIVVVARRLREERLHAGRAAPPPAFAIGTGAVIAIGTAIRIDP